ncbi:Transposase [Streptomyces hygroscopicus subsp. limoneus]|nr:Transposase [Streptomyces hygroscopicus subsp. limoneus]
MAEQSKNYRYSTNHQVVIDAGTRLVVAVGRPVPGNRNDCKAWELSGAKDAVGKTTVIADGGYRGTGLVIPHRRERGQADLPGWKQEHNASHREVGGAWCGAGGMQVAGVASGGGGLRTWSRVRPRVTDRANSVWVSA